MTAKIQVDRNGIEIVLPDVISVEFSHISESYDISYDNGKKKMIISRERVDQIVMIDITPVETKRSLV